MSVPASRREGSKGERLPSSRFHSCGTPQGLRKVQSRRDSSALGRRQRLEQPPPDFFWFRTRLQPSWLVEQCQRSTAGKDVGKQGEVARDPDRPLPCTF